MTEVKISKRDILVDYTIDKKSVAQLSEEYGVEFEEMKKIIRMYNISVRKNELAPTPKPKSYTIILTDLGNKTLEQVEAESKKEPVTA